MSKTPLYIFIDDQTMEIHQEKGFHLKEGRILIELEHPTHTFTQDDTDGPWHELTAKLGEWLTKHHAEQDDPQ